MSDSANNTLTGISTSAPVIITGTQRSGTTLLHHVLSCSSVIWSRNEMYEVHGPLFAERYRSREKQLLSQLQKFLKLDLPELPLSDDKQSRAELLRQAMQLAASNAGKPRWCLKDPQATYYLQDYAKTLPTAKFIVLLRDPRAVCHSYMSPRGFNVGRPANYISGAQRWKQEVQLQLHLKERHPERVLLVYYESLVKNFDSEIARVAGYLEIPFEPSMQDYFNRDTAIHIHSGNENILSPPDPSKIESWRNSMTPSQIRHVESVAGPMMDKLGYEQLYSPQPIGKLRFALATLQDRIVREYRWRRYKLLQQ